ncbi:MAG: cytochrome c oxidase assembly protein [Alphaproteobacteria bacterium]|nr:cytochrome c oxidase assembly protein [Alphaproteobacteria bacterium]
MTAASNKNRKLIVKLLAVVAAMIGLSFASVPLYNLFCSTTGFGGTTRRAAAAPEAVAGRVITVSFNADVNRDLAWEFHPMQTAVRFRVGEVGIAKYSARNKSAVPVVGTAVFNVQPDKAGPYFNKIECFCFTEQLLAPGEAAEFPVTFFIDPAIMDDPDMADVTDITLSYTFYRAKDQSKARAAALALHEGTGKGTIPPTTLQ